jgi:DNA-directed RNA polymerase specialized sigma24 family protein
VERARQGDRDAFAELARVAATRLDAAARLILRDSELARDAVQEALIRVKNSWSAARTATSIRSSHATGCHWRSSGSSRTMRTPQP